MPSTAFYTLIILLALFINNVENGPLPSGSCFAACVGSSKGIAAVMAALFTGGIGAVAVLTGVSPAIIAGCAALCTPLLALPTP